MSDRTVSEAAKKAAQRIEHKTYEGGLTIEEISAVIQSCLDEAARNNPCSKIFDHKWLDPKCIEKGCQSLAARVEPQQDLANAATPTARELSCEETDQPYWAVHSTSESNFPLASFVCKYWARRWKHKYCRTGEIRLEMRRLNGLTESELQELAMYNAPPISSPSQSPTVAGENQNSVVVGQPKGGE